MTMKKYRIQNRSPKISHTCVPLTLFYTRGLRIVVLHVMVPQPYRFSLGYFTKVWQFNHTRVLFQMGECHSAIQRGGMAACSWGWGEV